MGNFNRDRGYDRNDRGWSGGGGGFRDNNRGGYGNKRSFDRPQVQMHDATCDNCGKSCQVPFRPTGEKPVYCNDCFAQRNNSREDHKGYGNDRSDRRPSFSPPANDSDLKDQLVSINAKLDRLLRALELRSNSEAPKAMVFEPAAAEQPKQEKFKPAVKVTGKLKSKAKTKAKPTKKKK